MSDSENPWIVAHQTPLSMRFSRQEYWSGLPFPPPGDLPDPGIEPASPTLQAGSLSMSHQGRATEALGDQDSHVWQSPWVGKIPWKRKRQPTPVLLPGKSHGQSSLVGYSPWGRKERTWSSDFTYSLTTWPSHFTPRYLSKKNVYVHTHTCTQVTKAA